MGVERRVKTEPLHLDSDSIAAVLANPLSGRSVTVGD